LSRQRTLASMLAKGRNVFTIGVEGKRALA
jgi:hypothetical protein